MIIRKITITKESVKPSNDLNEELQWLSKSLGMFNERDKESSQFRIFIELIKAKKELIWEPKITLKYGLQKTINWFNKD